MEAKTAGGAGGWLCQQPSSYTPLPINVAARELHCVLRHFLSRDSLIIFGDWLFAIAGDCWLCQTPSHFTVTKLANFADLLVRLQRASFHPSKGVKKFVHLMSSKLDLVLCFFRNDSISQIRQLFQLCMRSTRKLCD